MLACRQCLDVKSIASLDYWEVVICSISIISISMSSAIVFQFAWFLPLVSLGEALNTIKDAMCITSIRQKVPSPQLFSSWSWPSFGCVLSLSLYICSDLLTFGFVFLSERIDAIDSSPRRGHRYSLHLFYLLSACLSVCCANVLLSVLYNKVFGWCWGVGSKLSARQFPTVNIGFMMNWVYDEMGLWWNGFR